MKLIVEIEIDLRDDGSALMVKVDGKQACLCCGLVEGHKDYCVHGVAEHILAIGG